jgi:hypothetical protein
MAKRKTFAIIAAGSVLHLGLLCFLIGKGLNCEMGPSCVTAFQATALKVLSLPLGLIPFVMEHIAHRRINLLGPLGSGAFILMALNSILAVCLIWFGLVRPLMRWRNGFRVHR